MEKNICGPVKLFSSLAPLGEPQESTNPASTSAEPENFSEDLAANRARFASLVLTHERPRSLFERSPLSLSFWSLLPVACNSESPANDDVGGGNDSGSDIPDPSDPGTPTVHPPRYQSQSVHDETPCGADGMITDLDPRYGVCANYASGNHHLFRWDSFTSGALVSVTSLPFPPDQMLELSGGEILITTHENPGLSVIDPNASTESHIAFPASLAISGITSSGRPVSTVTPTFPKGLVEHGDEVFIATSNLDHEHGDYLPGTVLAFDRHLGSFAALQTSGYNATGLALANGRLVVVSSGAIDQAGNATSPAYLDVFDPATHNRLQSLALGTNAAGLSGEISLSADQSTLVLPTADNSGRILVVNLQNLSLSSIDLRSQGVTGSRVFFNNLQLSSDGRYAWVSNFNDGRTYTIDLSTGTRVETPPVLDDNILDARGLSDALLRGSDLYMGRGSEILRVRYSQ